ncbi:MAG: hypothetical protein ACPLKZ_06860 [Candidatus Bathyarchaeales archaeon]
MGWKGRDWTSTWPGRGPFSHLPPWQRPGWLYGRGTCWYLHSPYSAVPPLEAEGEAALLAREKALIEDQLKVLQETLRKIEERLKELTK